MIELSGIPEHKKVNEITKKERERFVSLLKHLELTITEEFVDLKKRSLHKAELTSKRSIRGRWNQRRSKDYILQGKY